MSDHKPTPDEVLAKWDARGNTYDIGRPELTEALREAIRQRDVWIQQFQHQVGVTQARILERDKAREERDEARAALEHILDCRFDRSPYLLALAHIRETARQALQKAEGEK